MTYHPKPYDGDMPLNKLEEACEIEQIVALQLSDIRYGIVLHNGTVFPVNNATYEEKIIGKLRNLSFNEVSSDEDAAKIKEKIGTEGWTFICDTHVYAGKDGETHLLRVIVAGKKTF